MPTMVVLCVKHRVLWPFGQRWHTHMEKPVDQVAAADYAAITEANGRWWRVQIIGRWPEPSPTPR